MTQKVRAAPMRRSDNDANLGKGKLELANYRLFVSV
jgi:hypothetical protein